MCIPFILSGSPNECCDVRVITTWRLGLLAPLVTHNNNNNNNNNTNNNNNNNRLQDVTYTGNWLPVEH